MDTRDTAFFAGGVVREAPAWLLWRRWNSRWECVGGAETRRLAQELARPGDRVLPKGQLPEDRDDA